MFGRGNDFRSRTVSTSRYCRPATSDGSSVLVAYVSRPYHSPVFITLIGLEMILTRPFYASLACCLTLRGRRQNIRNKNSSSLLRILVASPNQRQRVRMATESPNLLVVEDDRESGRDANIWDQRMQRGDRERRARDGPGEWPTIASTTYHPFRRDAAG